MYRVPLGNWAEHVVSFLQNNVQPFFDAVTTVVNDMYNGVDWVLGKPEPLLLAAILAVVAFWLRGPLAAVAAFLGLALIDSLQLWAPAMQTLSQVIVASAITIVLAVPLGIWSARSSWGNALLRPVLDLMQTMPAFVYLIPAAMLFGLGRVPGILSTVIFAMPPAVRLTSLGIKHVNREIVEAGQAFGCTPWQLLYKVQFPNALPSIMTGVNQTIMMALSMVIIASMVGAGGLGNDVLASIQRLDIGLGFESGLSVVLLAIILDRITESFGRSPGMARAPLLSGIRSVMRVRRAPAAQQS